MKINPPYPTFAVVVLVLLQACAVTPQEDFARARDLARSSAGVTDVYDPDQPDLTPDQIDSVLAEGLTLDEAVRLALTHNRPLQAAFMEIGIAKADWVQSGLLRNPTLGVAVLLPEGGGRSFVEASIAQNLVDIWQLPTRRKIARHQLDATVLRIARLAGELAADTRAAYFEAVAAHELLLVARENAAILSKSHDAIRQKQEAGAASRFDESLARSQSLNGDLLLQSAVLEAATTKQKLAKLLSLDRDMQAVQLTDALPDVRPENLDAEPLLALARSRRLDLQAYESAMHAAGVEVALERSKAFGDVEAGVRVEREDRYKVGPTLSLEIPLFDQNQAQVARRKYLHLQSLKTYEGAYAQAAQDIRTAIDTTRAAAQSLTLHRQSLVPQAQSNLDLATQVYESGQITILGLIELQQRLLEARRGMIQSQREAATALADLMRAIGGPIENDLPATLERKP